MVKLVYTLGLGPSARKSVEVQVLSPALSPRNDGEAYAQWHMREDEKAAAMRELSSKATGERREAGSTAIFVRKLTGDQVPGTKVKASLPLLFLLISVQ